jgi:hypothetical protein
MQQLSEKAVATLPVPDSGNKVHWFSGATLQGKKAPAGFGVRVTAGGYQVLRTFPQGGRPQVSRDARPLGREPLEALSQSVMRS